MVTVKTAYNYNYGQFEEKKRKKTVAVASSVTLSVEKLPVVISLRLVGQLKIWLESRSKRKTPKYTIFVDFGKIFTWRLSNIYDEFERISLYRKLNTVTSMIKLYKI